MLSPVSVIVEGSAVTLSIFIPAVAVMPSATAFILPSEILNVFDTVFSTLSLTLRPSSSTVQLFSFTGVTLTFTLYSPGAVIADKSALAVKSLAVRFPTSYLLPVTCTVILSI